jgi:hypothetical protein
MHGGQIINKLDLATAQRHILAKYNSAKKEVCQRCCLICHNLAPASADCLNKSRAKIDDQATKRLFAGLGCDSLGTKSGQDSY